MANVSFHFKDRLVLISGGAKGIGLSTAKAFKRAGAKVLVADILRPEDDAFFEFYSCDVSSLEQIHTLFESIKKDHGVLDFSCHFAGISGQMTPLEQMSLDQWQSVIDINLRGACFMMQGAANLMSKDRGGSIVNISSVMGLVGMEYLAPYVASKHGVIGLTKSYALELADKNIRVNALCPGPVRTQMLDPLISSGEEGEKNLISKVPLGRIAHPEEIAEGALFLCSSAASYMTGHALVIDGGMTSR